MCERGLQVPASARAQSEFWELLAISSAQLGYPRACRSAGLREFNTRRSFQRPRRRNLEMFETAVTSSSPQPRTGRAVPNRPCVPSHRKRKFGRKMRPLNGVRWQRCSRARRTVALLPPEDVEGLDGEDLADADVVDIPAISTTMPNASPRFQNVTIPA